MSEPWNPARTAVVDDEVTGYEDEADGALNRADEAASLEQIITHVGRAIVMQLRANRALQERELASFGEILHADLHEIDEAITDLK